MRLHTPQTNKGFTLIETMIAIFILTIALSALITVTTSSIFSARYATNAITANYLLEEAVDYVRNDRDNVDFKQSTGGAGWSTFLNEYGYGSSGACFSTSGCYFEPASISVTPPTICPSGTCPKFNYDTASTNNDYYTYRNPTGAVPSLFSRKILMKLNSSNADELDITVIVTWQNGTLSQSQTLQVSLLNWQK